MSLPRLSVFIRAFGDVSENRIDTDVTLVEKKHFEVQRKAKESKLSWEDFASIVIDNQHYGVKTRLELLLKDLKNYTREIVDVDSTWDLVETAAMYFFDTFHDTDMISCQQLRELKLKFGNFSRSVLDKLHAVVKELTSVLPESVVDLLTENHECRSSPSTFGKGIKFNNLALPGSLDYAEHIPGDFSDIELNGVIAPISLKYTNGNSKPSNKTNDPDSKKKDKHWFKNLMRQYFDPGSVDDLTETVQRLLSSSKTNEELQNDLFELLGFDRFELIESLLERRLEIIVLSAQCDPLQMKCDVKKSDKRPNFGCQVVIQSESERELMKQIRRDEKKVQRLRPSNEEEMAPRFDAQYLRSKREESLMEASRGPILRQRTQPQITYPNVYDTYLEAKQAPGYICGVKMVLPVGFERRNQKEYEEVIIPLSEPPPLKVGNKLKPIAELDEIGQTCFQGMKTLNRIQTLVFDTAYHSNENLLICAPTGAGKTNIAMLTIIHQLKQHMQNGVIQKDKFKVVYVAPMKALAAEMVQNFSTRLQTLGISVKELTGDMQLTKSEIAKTQIIVTTPEKWDVITRKGTGDVGLTQLVRLLIFDEVHLLHGDRGPVVEALVARTLRQVESTQSMIRIVGLSATLPNYVDVAAFLHVNLQVGLFFFDSRFRPVPLSQTFIGVKAVNPLQNMQDMDAVTYEKAASIVDKGHQVMVFVHARNATVRTALVMREMANNRGQAHVFETQQTSNYGLAEKQVMRSRNKELRELFPSGFSIHHAGMLRQDRNMVEKLFREGFIKVLVCTSTLAWGVNLPAHAVIIRGTEIYDAKHGSFVDLSALDVLQIFGRAGRPQFDKSGHGIIVTSHNKLAHYLSLLTNQYPIESQFVQSLTDNLNAEIVLGTVANVDDAVRWLSYTYLFVRMKKNPHVYGIKYQMVKDDVQLVEYRNELIVDTARKLDKANMVRYEERTGSLRATDLGRTASHFYIKYHTVELINEELNEVMNEGEILSLVSQAEEFNQLKVREDEMDELENNIHNYCNLPVKGGKENTHGKVNILIQSHISRGMCNTFSLISDQNYIVQNSTRIMRAIFEIVLRRHWPVMADRLLRFSKILEHQLWGFENPLRQFSSLGFEVLSKLEEKELTIEKLKEMDAKEIGHFIHHLRAGDSVKRCVNSLPTLQVEASIQPITRSILRVRVTIVADFRWDDRLHGNTAESFWIWVEDPKSNYMHHYEYFLVTKKQVVRKEPQELIFTIPITEPLPNQYYVRIVSDRWLGSEMVCALSFQHLILPERHPPHTELLDLDPLPIKALQNSKLESLFGFTHFNPIQTQVFHTLYHSDSNVLIGAPTGSGKTIAAEIAMFRVFREYPGTKVVYIAPLKALVRERIEDWKDRLEKRLGKMVVEMTGDITPDVRAIASADVIVTTPEKWDGVSRSWQTRNYVKSVSLIIIDEIHLLGEERGPVLEVIVSRTNFISSHTDFPLRVIGLSTALANARDLADWLRIKEFGLFNFRPSVRPVPLEVHIEGFTGKHYCPRMATMNKPTFQAIRIHSPTKPTLVFVSSRRQTRLTALDLIAYLAAEDNPKQWMHMPENELDDVIGKVKDVNLKLTLSFGVGIHHAGLQDKDRKIVESLFVNQKIQVLVATATLAWGVNFPAHLVVIKGTEYYDGKTRRYVDFPVTDVLQMMGRAGRPQYDEHGVAVVLVHDIKKNFYRKFLYSPFPVESHLLQVLPDHLNAEVVAGTVTTKQDCMDYLTWTYFFRRLIQNPNFYQLESTEHENINTFLSKIVETALCTLEESTCLRIEEDCRTIRPTTAGRIASFYYLFHSTVRHFHEKMGPETSTEQLIEVLCGANEYDELPVRHNEDIINSDFAKLCPLPVNQFTYDSPHTKANLLFQAHFSRLTLPSTDYGTDLKSVMDQAIRILQAMLDIAADNGWLATAISVVNLLQMVLQGRWTHDNSLLTLPHIEAYHLRCFQKGTRSNHKPIECLPQLLLTCNNRFDSLASMLRSDLDENEIEQIFHTISLLPLLSVAVSVKGWWEECWEEQERLVDIQRVYSSKPKWISVHADQEYILNITLNRTCNAKKLDSRALAPRFPKPKDEGWFLILGDVEKKELLALKRIGFVSKRTNCQLSFYTPEKMGKVIYTIYILSDSYLGLDQQYDIPLDVIAMSLEAQVNTEVQCDE